MLMNWLSRLYYVIGDARGGVHCEIYQSEQGAHANNQVTHLLKFVIDRNW